MVTFNEEILNGKLHFLCSDNCNTAKSIASMQELNCFENIGEYHQLGLMLMLVEFKMDVVIYCCSLNNSKRSPYQRNRRVTYFDAMS